jgi:hypothetical protein
MVVPEGCRQISGEKILLGFGNVLPKKADKVPMR